MDNVGQPAHFGRRSFLKGALAMTPLVVVGTSLLGPQKARAQGVGSTSSPTS